MQTKIIIPTTNDKEIYGTLDTCNEDRELVIFVHGFTGSPNQHMYFNAVPFFNEREISCFRFGLYGIKEKSRKTSKVSFDNHTTDLEKVIAYFSKRYSKLYVVGHSLGAPVVIHADHSKAEKIVLWEPTSGFKSIEEKGMIYVDEFEAYLCDQKMQILFGKDLIEQWQKLTIENMLENIDVPAKFIFAKNYTKYSLWKKHLSHPAINNNFSVIEGATHDFTEPGTAQELYKETYDWFAKI